MNPENPNLNLDPEFHLYQPQPHKNLRMAHDVGLIITEKREHKPVDDFTSSMRSLFLAFCHYFIVREASI